MLIGGQGDKIVDGTDGRFRQSHWHCILSVASSTLS
jgi:hypothetical protein